jgi:signal transduction histidine kinase
LAGGVWALAAVLFIHPTEPLTVAFTLCGLYGVTGGAVPGNAYHRPAVTWFIWPVFAAVLGRLAWEWRVDFFALGLASLGFAGIMSLFCRVQNASIRESLRVRFENRALLARVAAEKEMAEAARAQAEQANLSKSQFLAAASHDLRQPLHALGLFSASLEALVLDDKARAVVKSVQTSIDALETLFDALLDISRLDAGVVQARPEPVELGALLAGELAALMPLALAKGLRLRLHVPEGAWAQADPMLLRRIVGNLLGNALRYTPRGTVLLAARRRGKGWQIECRDSGIGIAAESQRRVFDEFVQLHNPERDRRHGLGLGLAIAQRSAALLGSRIRLRSAPGRGSVFSLTLPLALPRAPVPASGLVFGSDGAAVDSAGPADPLQGKLILVIDDEAAIRDGLEMLLNQWGCQVRTAADHAGAMAAAAQGRPDLVLADLRLPGALSGLDTLAHLRERHGADLPVCLVTGEADPTALRAARDSGVPLLHKPVRPAKLRATLLHLLQRAES